jgi:hypothetical protein
MKRNQRFKEKFRKRGELNVSAWKLLIWDDVLFYFQVAGEPSLAERLEEFVIRVRSKE